MNSNRPVAVITGASSGIGAATARALARSGFEVVLGARRVERLRALADECGGRFAPLDVTEPVSVEAFVETVGDRVDVLVNNAGGALGMSPVASAVDEQWQWMYESNVLGTVRMTRALLPRLVASGAGHVVLIGSVAGEEVYPGGGGYTAVKHAVRAVTRTLRLELLGQPVRVTEIAPGMVETEFSLVRLGDPSSAAAVYRDMTPLVADDVADCVQWVVTRPAHVNIDYLRVTPRDQASTRDVHRRPASDDGAATR